MQHERFRPATMGMKMGLGLLSTDNVCGLKGKFIIHLVDSRTGEVLDHREIDNLITLDAGILLASLIASGPIPLSPVPTGQAGGITMLGVGTGATGPLLNPNAPDARQRQLNSELTLGRQPFTGYVFRNGSGAISSVWTNVVDFTCSFGEGEAVGPINEMGLMRTVSMNPTVKNPVGAVWPAYDPTVDLSTFDILLNYSTFSVVSKPSTSILTVTWRLTF